MYEEQPKKFSGFLEHPVTRAINFKIWPILQRKLPENDHFLSHFFVLAIKFHRINLFKNRFQRLFTFRAYLPVTPTKGQTYDYNWSSHNAHYGYNGHYGRYGSTNYGHKFDLYGCPWKIWSKCRSPVKTMLKKIHPTQFHGQS